MSRCCGQPVSNQPIVMDMVRVQPARAVVWRSIPPNLNFGNSPTTWYAADVVLWAWVDNSRWNELDRVDHSMRNAFRDIAQTVGVTNRPLFPSESGLWEWSGTVLVQNTELKILEGSWQRPDEESLRKICLGSMVMGRI